MLFLGAGVSMSSEGKGGIRPPSWVGFLEKCLGRCQDELPHVDEMIRRGDLLSACEVLKDRLSDDWAGILSQDFSDPQFRPALIHQHLFNLDSRLVLTQNFDKIFDVYALSETSGSTKVKNYYDDDTPMVLRGNVRAIIKVHGTIDEPSKMIFTRRDYASIRNSYRGFNLLMDALLLTHTFLFVGTSLADPDLRLFLENHASLYETSRPHFMTIPTSECHPDIEPAIKANLNIRLLPYDPVDGHVQLTQGLAELVEAVDVSRVKVAERQDW